MIYVLRRDVQENINCNFLKKTVDKDNDHFVPTQYELRDAFKANIQ